jgi:hypothetical protein
MEREQVDRLLVTRERYDNSADSDRPDQRVWRALRGLQRVRIGPKASGRQAAGRGVCALEDCCVGVGDQFRDHPTPVHRLFADGSLIHSWRDQGRVLRLQECRSLPSLPG